MVMNDVVLLFDCPDNLQMTVHGGDRTAVIDIIESLQTDPCNVGHPLIAKAISYYALAVRSAFQPLRSKRHRDLLRSLTPEQQKTRENLKMLEKQRLTKKQAQKNLDQIFKALVYDVRPTLTAFLMILGDAAACKYPPNYFDALSKIIREPEVSRNRRADLKIVKVKQRLGEMFPQVDHSSVLKFLEDIYECNSDLRLPRRDGGHPGAALRNVFVAWLTNSDPQSIKTYRSNMRGSFTQGPLSISPDTVEHIVEDVVLSLTPMTVLSPALRSPLVIDLSTLIVKTVTVNKKSEAH